MKLNRLMLLALTATLAPSLSFAADTYLTTNNQSEELQACGGTVRAKVSENQRGDQVNVVFKGLSPECNIYDIKGNNGTLQKYEARPFGSCGKTCGGSITIPKHMIDDGNNNLYVLVRGANGGRNDRVFVRFEAVSVPAPIPAPPIDVPVSGNGGW